MVLLIERLSRRFKSVIQAQRFVTTHAAAGNLFNFGRHLVKVIRETGLRRAAMCLLALASLSVIADESHYYGPGDLPPLLDAQLQNQLELALSDSRMKQVLQADRLGVDEGLMLDPHGFVSTCNSTNFFIIRDGEVWTSTGEYCLNGVTRASVIRLCGEYDVPVFEKNFVVEDVYTADEMFVTGTFAGVIPVTSVNGKKIGDGIRGPITQNLQDWYALDIEKLTADL